MKLKTIIALINIFFITSSLFASNNLDSNKNYDPIEVTIGSGKEAKRYILLNNGLDIYRWYYASLNPKLFEYGNPLEPDLTMIKYQRISKDKKGKLDEGASFQCSFDIGADESVLKKLKKYLPKELDQDKVRLSIIPLEGIELIFFKPNTKKDISIIASGYQDVAPLKGSKVTFNTNLDRNATTIMDTLLKSNMGVEYSIKYHYSFYSKPTTTSLTAKINRNKAVISGYSDDIDPALMKYIRNKENNPKFLQYLKSEFEKTSKKGNSTNSSKNNLDEDLKNIGHKNKVKPSRISDQSFSDFQKTIYLTYRVKEDKILVASGFISLNNYDKEIVKKKIIEDSHINWNYSYLVMPSISDKYSESIKQIKMLVELVFKNKVLEKRNYSWSKDRGWRNVEKNYPATIDKYDLVLIYTESSSDPLKYSNFRVKTEIEFEDDPPLLTECKLAVINGETPITTPFASYDTATFDFTNLTWDGLKTDKTRLVSMEINLKDGKRRVKKIIQPQEIKGTKAIETPSFLYLLTTKGSFSEGDMKATIYFRTGDGKKIPWEYNDVILNKYMPDPYFMFLDEEWKGK